MCKCWEHTAIVWIYCNCFCPCLPLVVIVTHQWMISMHCHALHFNAFSIISSIYSGCMYACICMHFLVSPLCSYWCLKCCEPTEWYSTPLSTSILWKSYDNVASVNCSIAMLPQPHTSWESLCAGETSTACASFQCGHYLLRYCAALGVSKCVAPEDEGGKGSGSLDVR